MSNLIEKLRQIAEAKPGDPMPECLRTVPTQSAEHLRVHGEKVSIGLENHNWGVPLSAIAREAIDEIERLRGDVLLAKVIGRAEANEIHRKSMEGLIAERDRQNGGKR